MIESQLVIPRLLNKKFLLAYFPLHSNYSLKGNLNQMSLTKIPNNYRTILNENKFSPFEKSYDGLKNELSTKNPERAIGLSNKWKFKLSKLFCVPTNAIRRYFGEKIGMSIELLRHYTLYSLIFSILGIIFTIIQIGIKLDQEEPSKPEYPFIIYATIFSICIICWSTIFFEHWKRKQVLLASKWGQSNFQVRETNRPQFTGYIRRSPVTDEVNELHFPSYKRKLRIIFGVLVTIFMILLSVSMVYIFMYLKEFLIEASEGYTIQWWISSIISAVNGMQIILFTLVYEKLVIKLTDYENHRTQSQYEKSLTIKSFAFHFLNSYYSLFYIAFMKVECIGTDEDGDIEISEDFSCVYELETHFRAILILVITKSIFQAIVPIFKQKMAFLRKVKQLDLSITPQKAIELGKYGRRLTGAVKSHPKIKNIVSFVEKEAMKKDYKMAGLGIYIYIYILLYIIIYYYI